MANLAHLKQDKMLHVKIWADEPVPKVSTMEVMFITGD